MGILAGALRGVGTYLVDEAKAQRDAALEQLRQDRADQRSQASAAAQHVYTLDEQTHGAAATGAQNRETLRVSEAAATAARREGYAHDDTHQARQFTHDVTLENLRSQHRISEEDAQWANSEQTRLAHQGEDVAEWRVANGHLGGYNARGELITESRAAIFTDPNVSYRSGHGGPAAPHRSAAPSTPSAPAADDQTILDRFGPVVDQTYGQLNPADRLQRARELAQRYGQ